MFDYHRLSWKRPLVLVNHKINALQKSLFILYHATYLDSRLLLQQNAEESFSGDTNWHDKLLMHQWQKNAIPNSWDVSSKHIIYVVRVMVDILPGHIVMLLLYVIYVLWFTKARHHTRYNPTMLSVIVICRASVPTSETTSLDDCHPRPKYNKSGAKLVLHVTVCP